MYPQYETKYMIRQTWCSVGSVWEPRLGHPLWWNNENNLFRIPAQDRDLYLEFLILNNKISSQYSNAEKKANDLATTGNIETDKATETDIATETDRAT